MSSERDLAVLRSFAGRIDPSDAGAHNNLGVLYFRKALYPEAVSSFSRALELDPKMSVAQRNLEIAYKSSGYYDRRITELREALLRHLLGAYFFKFFFQSFFESINISRSPT